MDASVKEAMFYEGDGDGRVRCRLCRHGCLIEPGQCGICRVRENWDGRLVSLVYGRPVAQAVDPIEKKPLYHFLPGSRAYSVGTRGCNFRCLHCQNCEISQVAADSNLSLVPQVAPERLVREAIASGCLSMAYTYTEPTIFYEYAFDTALLAREQGLKNVFVTNGYITAEALCRIAPLLDAVNVDLKFFRDDLYRKICGARLQPVLDVIRLFHELGLWVEITTLVIPGYNDDLAQLRQIAEFIAGMDKRMPWHLTAFHPAHKLIEPQATPPPVLRQATDVARKSGLQYVYMGNLSDNEGATTSCPHCGVALIERGCRGVASNRIVQGRCQACARNIAGVWV